jgi:Clp amino terminal domain, pathogenicity island component
MAQTGEKYTQARRALLAAGGTRRSAGHDPGVTITWPQDLLGWFTDQAYSAILLADDEARMLSHPGVAPEHLLLAAAHRGNVERLLAGEGIGARAIHDVIVQIEGFGGQLELRPRRSPASEQVLRRAITAAAARGVLGPSTQHLLIALGDQELPAQILAELGIGSAEALVDAFYRPPRLRLITGSSNGAPPTAEQHRARGQSRPSSNALPGKRAPPSAQASSTRAEPTIPASSPSTS